ncbi:DUF3515 domain-containing protein [Mycolicibacterium sp. 050158]|uniref:DUF3515 domain-containing protein n=1 Tax=Mycolicibacterium sp. 050158 TaxID=3090602 RepID=UPI0039A4FC25
MIEEATAEGPANVGDGDDDEDEDGPPRALLIAAIVVAVGAVVGILVFAAIREATPAPQPVAIAAAPAPHADGEACGALLKALPDALGDYHRAKAVEPVPAGAAAWQTASGGDPVILRCGLDRPDDFVVSSPLQVVDDVQWFRIPGDGRTTWVTVDRPVYVALTLPDDSGPTPIQVISRTVAQTLPATALDPAPAR